MVPPRVNLGSGFGSTTLAKPVSGITSYQIAGRTSLPIATFNSDILGHQLHISRLRRFYCDNLDRKNADMTDRLQFLSNANSSVNFQRGSSADFRKKPGQKSNASRVL
jgi:hypothetical protein